MFLVRHVFRLRWRIADWMMHLSLLVDVTELNVIVARSVTVVVVVVVVLFINRRIARHFKMRAVRHDQMDKLRVVLLQQP